ncbi:MAG TPA: hypothetical protein VN687_08750, partial [Blastocatellia bacterium]|nr:hypothetical protein [Blastocatellia bacterium]
RIKRRYTTTYWLALSGTQIGLRQGPFLPIADLRFAIVDFTTNSEIRKSQIANRQSAIANRK